PSGGERLETHERQPLEAGRADDGDGAAQEGERRRPVGRTEEANARGEPAGSRQGLQRRARGAFAGEEEVERGRPGQRERLEQEIEASLRLEPAEAEHIGAWVGVGRPRAELRRV